MAEPYILLERLASKRKPFCVKESLGENLLSPPTLYNAPVPLLASVVKPLLPKLPVIFGNPAAIIPVLSPPLIKF